MTYNPFSDTRSIVIHWLVSDGARAARERGGAEAALAFEQPHDAGPNVARSAGRSVTDVPRDQMVEKIMKRPIFESRVS